MTDVDGITTTIVVINDLAAALRSILADMDANRFPSTGIFAGINALNAYDRSKTDTTPVDRSDRWLPICDAPKGKKLILGYRNELGKWRTITGQYYLPGTLQSDEFDDTADEDGCAPQGWYEESETHETIMATAHPPTHWQPLPAAPGVI